MVNASMFERVYTVQDYYDQPRSGIAECLGEPHFYDREFSEALDEFSDTYFLTPINKKTLSLALEGWKLWLEWKHTYSKTEPRTHPYFQLSDIPTTSKYVRCFEINQIIKAHVVNIKVGRKRAKAKFRVHLSEAGISMSQSDVIEVEWSDIENV